MKQHRGSFCFLPDKGVFEEVFTRIAIESPKH
jgi:hypothetical protein